VAHETKFTLLSVYIRVMDKETRLPTSHLAARWRSPQRVAVLHQAAPAPEVDGIVKPMKPGGYQDSAADIAYVLQSRRYDIVTPRPDPDPHSDEGWSYPDTTEGITEALSRGATVLWANTVLYRDHPLRGCHDKPYLVVGQPPATVHRWEDKFDASQMLASVGLPVAEAHLVASVDEVRGLLNSGAVSLPVVVKPVRGRGSEGVAVVTSTAALENVVGGHLAATVHVDGIPRSRFGNRVIIEEFLPGRELTLTVMPPGRYRLDDNHQTKTEYWALPPVERRGHHDNVAPYNGIVAVMRNSRVVSDHDPDMQRLISLAHQCEKTAAIVGPTAPIRIDCRADVNGVFRLFDINLKPNMTGAGRPGRADQDSLSCLAARAVGWNYGDLLEAMLTNACPSDRIRRPSAPKPTGPQPPQIPTPAGPDIAHPHEQQPPQTGTRER